VPALCHSPKAGVDTGARPKCSATARLYAPKGSDEQTPHDLDEFGIVAAGIGHYRVGETVTAFGPGDLLFTAAMSTIDSRIFLPISPSGSNSTGRRSSEPAVTRDWSLGQPSGYLLGMPMT
jgi:hypothetical protein